MDPNELFKDSDKLVSDMDQDIETQTFEPKPPSERPRQAGRPQAKIRSLENIRDHAKNRYEAVLIASARARQLNAKKVALEERGMEEAFELKRFKMTTFALHELLDGKIEVTRPEEKN